MIVSFDENTFGERKKLVSFTRVRVKCDNCLEKEWETSWTYRKKRGFDYCQSCKNKLGISGMKGKTHSDELKKKMSERNKGDKNPSKRKDVRKKISQKLKGRKVEWLVGKKRPEHSKKMKKYMNEFWDENNDAHTKERQRRLEILAETRKLFLKGGTFCSKLHKSVKGKLKENKINGFKSEQNIGRYFVDELNEEKSFIIEVKGDFWHANPAVYREDDILPFPGRKLKAKEIWEMDKNREKFLSSLGYRIYVIWEKDWNDVKKRKQILLELKGVLDVRN